MVRWHASLAVRWVAACAALAVTTTGHPVLAAKPAASDAAAEASYVAKQAIDYYKNGDPRMAADLYRRAYRIDPSKPDYLFGAARAEQKAGHAKEAIVTFENVLALLPSTDPLAKKARAAIDELHAAELPVTPPEPPQTVEPPKPIEVPKPVEPLPPVVVPRPQVPPPVVIAPQEPPPVVVAPQEPRADWKRPTGWTLVATGSAVLVTGAILGGLAASGRSTLDGNKLADGHYDPTKIDHDGIVAQQTAINSKATGAVVCGVVGAVAAGVGTWALLTAPGKVSVTSGPGLLGASLAVRF